MMKSKRESRVPRGVATQHGIRAWKSEGAQGADKDIPRDEDLLLKGVCQNCRFKVELSFPNSSEGWAAYHRWREELFSHSDDTRHTVMESLIKGDTTLSYPIKPSKRAWWQLDRWLFYLLGFISVFVAVAVCCVDGNWIRFPFRLGLNIVFGWIGAKLGIQLAHVKIAKLWFFIRSIRRKWR